MFMADSTALGQELVARGTSKELEKIRVEMDKIRDVSNAMTIGLVSTLMALALCFASVVPWTSYGTKAPTPPLPTEGWIILTVMIMVILHFFSNLHRL